MSKLSEPFSTLSVMASLSMDGPQLKKSWAHAAEANPIARQSEQTSLAKIDIDLSPIIQGEQHVQIIFTAATILVNRKTLLPRLFPLGSRHVARERMVKGQLRR
jgi:hypothetical protein